MSHVLTELRKRLRAVEWDGFQRRPELPFGVEAIDRRLAGGGLRLDAPHEVGAATPSLADETAAMSFVAGIAARAWGPVLWAARRRDLFAPDLSQSGLADHRVIHAEARDEEELVALMEEGLRHRGLGAVVGEAKRAGPAAMRRLRIAAEGGRTIALMLRRHARAGADPLVRASGALTSWRIGFAPPGGPGTRPCWDVELARQEGGEPFRTTVRSCDATGRMAPLARAAPGRSA